MKNLIVLIFILFPLETNAQQYKSVFGENSTQWNLLREGGDIIYTDSLYTIKDSVINNLNYKVIISYRSGEEFFLRESAEKNKVFLYKPEKSDEEFIVLDLTLEKSDTFMIGYYEKTPLVVDSVYYQDNLKHIRFDHTLRIPSGDEYFEFVEGVGSTFGLFYQLYDPYEISISHYLLCLFKDGERVYSNQSPDFAGKCNVLIYTGINQHNNYRTILYPNPASQIIRFKAKDIRKPFHLKVYDFKGHIMKEVADITGSETINISDLPEGIYFYRLDFKDYVIYDKLIISR